MVRDRSEGWWGPGRPWLTLWDCRCDEKTIGEGMTNLHLKRTALAAGRKQTWEGQTKEGARLTPSLNSIWGDSPVRRRLQEPRPEVGAWTRVMSGQTQDIR